MEQRKRKPKFDRNKKDKKKRRGRPSLCSFFKDLPKKTEKDETPDDDVLSPYSDMEIGCAVPYCRAMEQGDFDKLRKLSDAGCPWTKAVALCAVKLGHTDMLKYAIKHGCPYDYSIMRWAAKYGHLDIVQYAESELGMKCIKDISMVAAYGNHLHILNWLEETGKRIDEECKFIVSQKLEEDMSNILDKTFKESREEDSSLSVDISYSKESDVCLVRACENNDLERIKELRSKGYPWETFSMTEIGCNGNLEILKYAHGDGMPLRRVLFLQAVKHGHIPILEYCVKNGYRISDNASLWCLWNKRNDVFEWLCEHGAPINPDCKWMKMRMEKRKQCNISLWGRK